MESRGGRARKTRPHAVINTGSCKDNAIFITTTLAHWKREPAERQASTTHRAQSKESGEYVRVLFCVCVCVSVRLISYNGAVFISSSAMLYGSLVVGQVEYGGGSTFEYYTVMDLTFITRHGTI